MKKILAHTMMLALAFAALTATSCTTQTPSADEALLIPEVKHPDWAKLRLQVREYEATRADADGRSLLVAQSQLQSLVDGHSNDRIGDEALYYVGRIYYDIRDYHDARMTFVRHNDMFPRSQFIPTIQALENEMAKSDAEYRSWLEASRTTILVR